MTALEKLEQTKEQLYRLIKSAYNDPYADPDEIDRYLDLLNQVNSLIEKIKNNSFVALIVVSTKCMAAYTSICLKGFVI